MSLLWLDHKVRRVAHVCHKSPYHKRLAWLQETVRWCPNPCVFRSDSNSSEDTTFRSSAETRQIGPKGETCARERRVLLGRQATPRSARFLQLWLEALGTSTTSISVLSLSFISCSSLNRPLRQLSDVVRRRRLTWIRRRMEERRETRGIRSSCCFLHSSGSYVRNDRVLLFMTMMQTKAQYGFSLGSRHWLHLPP